MLASKACLKYCSLVRPFVHHARSIKFSSSQKKNVITSPPTLLPPSFTNSESAATQVEGDTNIAEVEPISPKNYMTMAGNGKEFVFHTQGLQKDNKATTEGRFQRVVQEVFQDEEIIFNNRSYFNLRHPINNTLLEVDVIIPGKKLAMEFQDSYHHTPAVHNSNRPLKEIQMLDAYKKQAFKSSAFTFLQFGCWWDGTVDSFKATLKQVRHDLWPNYEPKSLPVSEIPPNNFFNYIVVPVVGVPMKAIYFTQKLFRARNDWLLGEKKDGIRFLWNPIERILYSSHGNQLRFIEEFKQLMPNAFIEGEVWFERDSFNNAVKLKSTSKQPVEWSLVRLGAFDIYPDCTANDETPYKDRYAKLCEIIPRNHPFLTVIPMIPVTGGEQQLIAAKTEILKQGGEGIVLRGADSIYEQGYSYNLLKDAADKDMEAKVVSITPKFIVLQLPDGTIFKSSPNCIPKGESIQANDVITIYFRRRKNGTTLPLKPKFKRVRKDFANWEEYVAGIQVTLGYKGQDYSDRYDKDTDAVRDFFITFAKSKQFDFSSPENWYPILKQHLLGIKGVHSMLKWYKGSHIAALMDAFPEISFDVAKFAKVPRNFWQSIENVRQYFCDYAFGKGFDPLVTDEWYRVSHKDISEVMGTGPLKYFKGSHINALMVAFPEIGLDPSKFAKVSQNFWRNENNIRCYFFTFAKVKGFDPLVPTNWYCYSHKDIVDVMGKGPLNYYNDSHIKALAVAYPDIKLEPHKFHGVKKKFSYVEL